MIQGSAEGRVDVDMLRAANAPGQYLKRTAGVGWQWWWQHAGRGYSAWSSCNGAVVKEALRGREGTATLHNKVL